LQTTTVPQADQSRLVTVQEAALIFGVSMSHVYEHVALNDFPVQAIRVGRLIRFRREDIERLLAGNGATP
jgi:excisionase family DNA binding protein